MILNGEDVEKNVQQAVHHFDILANYNDELGHWNLGLVYENEEGFQNTDRSVYHFRIAADLGLIQARDRVGEYFTSVTRPRMLSFTGDEIKTLI